MRRINPNSKPQTPNKMYTMKSSKVRLCSGPAAVVTSVDTDSVPDVSISEVSLVVGTIAVGRKDVVNGVVDVVAVSLVVEIVAVGREEVVDGVVDGIADRVVDVVVDNVVDSVVEGYVDVVTDCADDVVVTRSIDVAGRG